MKRWALWLALAAAETCDESALLHLRYQGWGSSRPGQILFQALDDNSTAGKLAGEMAKQLSREIGNDTKKVPKAVVLPLNQSNASNASAVESSIFVRANYNANASSNGTAVQVKLEIAACSQILWVFVLIWSPLLLGWGWYFHQKSDFAYSQLLQFSVGAFTVSHIIGNQSLCILTRAPMALTLVQSLLSILLGAAWWAVDHWSARDVPSMKEIREELWKWTPCGIFFALYQAADHLVSNTASISERVVLGNLVPVCAWVFELTFPELFCTGGSPSWSAKMAMTTTVCGALFFLLEDPNLAPNGLYSCGLAGALLLMYRLFQRGTLVRLHKAPVGCLLTFDCVISVCMSWAFFRSADTAALRDWQLWCQTPEVLLLLLLSGLGLGFGHATTILNLRNTSATLTMVICNVAAMLCIVQSLFLFSQDFAQPLCYVGMMINLIGGVWYATSQVGDTKA